MNRRHFLTIAGVVAFALPAIAQPSASPPAHHVPTVDGHLKALSDKLDLSAEQQEKARPILQQMHAAMQKTTNDANLSSDQMHEQMHSARVKADKELRPILSEEQKKKLDDLEAQSFPDEHRQP